MKRHPRSHVAGRVNASVKAFRGLLFLVGIALFSAIVFSEEPSQNATESVSESANRVPTFVPKKLDALFAHGSLPNPSGACYDQLNYRLFTR